MHILVAEDEPTILNLYKIVLQLKGHEVFLAKDGEECLTLFQQRAAKVQNSKDGPATFPFDIVLLDYRMPKKDGLQVATEILSMCPRQKIVMVSAFGSEIIEGLTKALKSSIKVLEKPIEMENLANILESERTKNNSQDAIVETASSAGLWITDKLKQEMK